MTVATAGARPEPDTYVRVLGTRRERYVEFELALDHPELSVELVLPVEGFLELCTERSAHWLPAEPEARAALERLCAQRGIDLEGT